MICRVLAALLAIIVVAAMAQARTRTTRKNISGSGTSVISDIPVAPDSLQCDTVAGFSRNAITFKGFAKRASDRKETFFATNHTNQRIGHFTVLMRYSDMQGNVLHERKCVVACDLKPGATSLASVRSFDQQSQFYYHQSSRRKNAVAFTVAMRLISYEVTIEE